MISKVKANECHLLVMYVANHLSPALASRCLTAVNMRGGLIGREESDKEEETRKEDFPKKKLTETE